MKKRTQIILLIASVLMFAGCSDLLSPENQNNRELSDIYDDAAFGEGLLLNGYIRLPNGSYSFNDVATDDAVSDNSDNSYLQMATGKWTSQNNPVDAWSSSYTAIQYLNTILQESDKVTWAADEWANKMFNDRTKGESYGLRALFMYYLLRAHGGYTNDGKLLGVPILTEPQDGSSDFNLPRNTFAECITQIHNDLDSAMNYLPLDFEDVSSVGDVPSKYFGATAEEYTRVFGAYNRERFTKRIAMGVCAQVDLLAASPAFNGASGVAWEDAANSAGDVLDLNSGLSGIASNGWYWYSKSNKTEISNLSSGTNPKEILWRTNVSDSKSLEADNYPPTLYGDGRVNPTQNLVDAFPMANGYPITDSRSGYDSSNPYANRDPRLAAYVVVNGSTEGPSSATINTSVGGTDDGLNAITTSTRTSYYMRKLLREDVNLNPNSTTKQRHYVPRIRYTELYLDYAEAANEAWGPDGTGSHGYSARDVIAAIRKRAGITQPDNYLASITSQDDMRTLIHNERRLELCFEGFRFWDLRRWKNDLTEYAKGVSISNGVYTELPQVEKRSYDSYMYYGPIPYTEVVKWSNLIQNKGW
jgi:starch-binding outer membrane protein, SusD/RagB family